MPTIQLATSNSDVCRISKLKSLPSRLNQCRAIFYFMITSIVTIIDIYFVSILMISDLGEMFHQTFRIHIPQWSISEIISDMDSTYRMMVSQLSSAEKFQTP